MEGLPLPSYWKLPKGKDLVSLKPGLLEACASDSSWSSSGPGLAPRGPELSRLFLSAPTKSVYLSLHSSLLPAADPQAAWEPFWPQVGWIGGTAEDTGVCQGLGKGGG